MAGGTAEDRAWVKKGAYSLLPPKPHASFCFSTSSSLDFLSILPTSTFSTQHTSITRFLCFQHCQPKPNANLSHASGLLLFCLITVDPTLGSSDRGRVLPPGLCCRALSSISFCTFTRDTSFQHTTNSLPSQHRNLSSISDTFRSNRICNFSIPAVLYLSARFFPRRDWSGSPLLIGGILHFGLIGRSFCTSICHLLVSSGRLSRVAF